MLTQVEIRKDDDDFNNFVGELLRRKVAKGSADISVLISPIIFEFNDDLARIAGEMVAAVTVLWLEAQALIPIFSRSIHVVKGRSQSPHARLHNTNISNIADDTTAASTQPFVIKCPPSINWSVKLLEMKWILSSPTEAKCDCSESRSYSLGFRNLFSHCEVSPCENLNINFSDHSDIAGEDSNRVMSSAFDINSSVKCINISGAVDWVDANENCADDISNHHSDNGKASLVLSIRTNVHSIKLFYKDVVGSDSFLNALCYTLNQSEDDRCCCLSLTFRDGSLAISGHFYDVQMAVNAALFTDVAGRLVSLLQAVLMPLRHCLGIEMLEVNDEVVTSHQSFLETPNTSESHHKLDSVSVFKFSKDSLQLPCDLNSVSLTCAVKSFGVSIVDASSKLSQYQMPVRSKVCVDDNKMQSPPGIYGLYVEYDFASSTLMRTSKEDGIRNGYMCGEFSTSVNAKLKSCFVSTNLLQDFYVARHRQQSNGCTKKDIFMPFSATILHSTTVKAEELEGGSLDGSRLHCIEHKLDVNIDKKESFLYLDSTLYLRIWNTLCEVCCYGMESVSTVSELINKVISGGIGERLARLKDNKSKKNSNNDSASMKDDHSWSMELDQKAMSNLVLMIANSWIFFDAIDCDLEDGGCCITVVNDLASYPRALFRVDFPEVSAELSVSRMIGDDSIISICDNKINVHSLLNTDERFILDNQFHEENSIRSGNLGQASYARMLSQECDLDLCISVSGISCFCCNLLQDGWEPFIKDIGGTINLTTRWKMGKFPMIEAELPAAGELASRETSRSVASLLLSERIDEGVGSCTGSVELHKCTEVIISSSLITCCNNLLSGIERGRDVTFHRTFDHHPTEYISTLSAFEAINYVGIRLRISCSNSDEVLFLDPGEIIALPRPFISGSFALAAIADGAVAANGYYSLPDVGKGMSETTTYGNTLRHSMIMMEKENFQQSCPFAANWISLNVYLNCFTGSLVHEFRSPLAVQNACSTELEVEYKKVNAVESIFSGNVLPNRCTYIPAEWDDNVLAVNVVPLPTFFIGGNMSAKSRDACRGKRVFLISSCRGLFNGVDTSDSMRKKSLWLESVDTTGIVHKNPAYVHVCIENVPPHPCSSSIYVDMVNDKSGRYCSRRTITISSPLIFTNNLARSIDVLLVGGCFVTYEKFRSSNCKNLKTASLITSVLAGDSFDCYEFACDADITVFFRLHVTSCCLAEFSNTFDDFILEEESRCISTPWSQCGMIVRGSLLPSAAVDENVQELTTLSARCMWLNSSELDVCLDVSYEPGGIRQLNMYVPFWIVTYSAHNCVQYQVSPIDDSNTEGALNGTDDLCADQVFLSEALSSTGRDAETKPAQLPTPIWQVSPALSSTLENITAHNESINEVFSKTIASERDILMTDSFSYLSPPYEIMMCSSYATNHVAEKCLLRLRIGHCAWSSAFDVKATADQLISAASSSSKGIDVGNTMSSRLFGGVDSNHNPFGSPATHDQTTDFIIKPCNAGGIQGLYPKTKVILVTDAFSLTNATKCVIRVRQYGCAASTVTCQPCKRVTFPWRDNRSRYLQIQMVGVDLDVKGTNLWSGKISTLIKKSRVLQVKKQKEDEEAVFLEVSSLGSNALQTHILLRSIPSYWAPVHIENLSRSQFSIVQRGGDHFVVVKPFMACEFTWEDDILCRIIAISKIGDAEEKDYRLVNIAHIALEDMSVRYLDGGTCGIGVEIYDAGPKKVVRVFDQIKLAPSISYLSSLSTPLLISRQSFDTLDSRTAKRDIAVADRSLTTCKSLFGFPFALSFKSKGAVLSFCNKNSSQSLSLRIDEFSTSCTDNHDSKVLFNFSVGNILVLCCKFPHERLSLSADGSGAGMPESENNVVTLFSGRTPNNGLPAPFIAGQVVRNISFEPGIIHIASAIIETTTSGLISVDEHAIRTIMSIINSTLNETHALYWAPASDMIISKALSTIQLSSASANNNSLTNTSVLDVSREENQHTAGHCAEEGFAIINPMRYRVDEAVAKTLLKFAGNITCSWLTAGRRNDGPLFFVENVNFSEALVSVRCNMATYLPNLSARALRHPYVVWRVVQVAEIVVRTVCVPMLNELYFPLRIPSPGLHLLGAGKGARGRIADVVEAMAADASRIYKQSLMGTLVNPKRMIVNIFHFMLVFGRSFLSSTASIIQRMSASFAHSEKLIYSKNIPLLPTFQPCYPAYYFDSVLSDGGTVCYLFANSSTVLIHSTTLHSDWSHTLFEARVWDIVTIQWEASTTAYQHSTDFSIAVDTNCIFKSVVPCERNQHTLSPITMLIKCSNLECDIKFALPRFKFLRLISFFHKFAPQITFQESRSEQFQMHGS